MICRDCGVDKSPDDFYRRPQMKSGYRPECKDCYNRKVSAYKKANRDKCREHTKKWQKGIGPYRQLMKIKRDLIIEQVNICAICDEQMLKPEIDHIRPVSAGGQSVRENLQVVCSPCNKEKAQKWS